jgi:endo-1,4-beta-xylanase
MSTNRKQRKRATYLVLAVIFIIVSILIILQYSAKQRSIDWLNHTDWSHYSGAEQVKGVVRIRPLGIAINHRDTSTAQPDPPVNIRGTHIRVPKEFQINMKLSGIGSEPTLQFYGQIPVIYDEWRQERQSIRLEVKNDGIRVRIWDGTSANSIDERVYKYNVKNKVSLGLIHKKDSFIVQMNGNDLGTIPDHNIFAAGDVWFGSDAKFGTDGWLLHSLTAKSLSKQPVVVIDSPALVSIGNYPDALRKLSETSTRKLPIGAAV